MAAFRVSGLLRFLSLVILASITTAAANYNESMLCGTTLEWSQYPPSNGFTVLCQFWAPLSDPVGRDTECRHTITGIPQYNDHTGLLENGGNFGCLISQNYPDDLPATSVISCADNYQHSTSLGNFTESARLMVCIRYPATVPCDSNPCMNGGTCIDLDSDSYTCTCPPDRTGMRCESHNYYESMTCGTTLDWANYNASNGFTRLCQFWVPMSDTVGRTTECRNTINGIPLYDDYIGLMEAGGNFGCIVSQDYPDDLPATSYISCADNYQHSTSLGNFTESARLMVCIRYPYDGIPEEDPCSSSPCLNSGTCTSGGSSFTCSCPDRYTGNRCETPTGPCNSFPCLNGGTCINVDSDSFTCTCPIEWTGVRCESPNYSESMLCGTTLAWSQYPASNGFTVLCYFSAPPEDTVGRATECRNTINGIPQYDDYVGLMEAGGNFGCLLSQNYPEDLPATSAISCVDNYQHDLALDHSNFSSILMVCLRYPYAGIPGRK